MVGGGIEAQREGDQDAGPSMDRRRFIREWLPGAAVAGGAALVAAAALENKENRFDGHLPTLSEILDASKGKIEFKNNNLTVRRVANKPGGVFEKRFDPAVHSRVETTISHSMVGFRYISLRGDRHEVIIVGWSLLDPTRYAVLSFEKVDPQSPPVPEKKDRSGTPRTRGK